MQVDLNGQDVVIVGASGAVGEAIRAAVSANGASVEAVAPTDAAMPTQADAAPDILIVVDELRPERSSLAAQLQQIAEAAGTRMAARGSGRIIFVLSALGAIPMRRHPQFSNAMAGAASAVRTLAMTLSPDVLVNAVGAGAIGTGRPEGDAALAAGSEHMLSHVPLARAGTPADIAGAVLFLCDPMNTYMTGQMLTVDGGWAAGYARNF